MKHYLLLSCHLLALTFVHSQSYEAHLELAKQAYFEGDLEIAIREINNAINYNRKESWTYYVRSKINAENRNYNEAYIDIDSAIRLEKDVYYYYAQRGECLFVFDKYEDALKDLNIALAGDSTLDEAYFNRYAILERQGELTQAMRDINKAIELVPDNIRYQYGKANLFEQLGERDSAIVYYTRTFHIAKHYSYFFSYLTSCDMMELNQLDTALSWHNWTLDNFGRFIGNLSGRGQTYMKMGRYKDAIQDFSELIVSDKRRLYGRVTTSFYFRGVCYDSLGDREKAMSDFNESLTWDTTNAKSYAGRASLYMRSGQTDRALRDLNKAVYHEPKLGIAYYLRGLIYLNDYKDSESACEDFMAARRFKYKPAIAMLRKNCGK